MTRKYDQSTINQAASDYAELSSAIIESSSAADGLIKVARKQKTHEQVLEVLARIKMLHSLTLDAEHLQRIAMNTLVCAWFAALEDMIESGELKLSDGKHGKLLSTDGYAITEDASAYIARLSAPSVDTVTKKLNLTPHVSGVLSATIRRGYTIGWASACRNNVRGYTKSVYSCTISRG